MQSTGSGGASEIVGHLQDNQAQYAYLRVEVQADESTRTKFVFIAWVGESTPALKKGKVSVDKYAYSIPLLPPFTSFCSLSPFYTYSSWIRPGLKAVIKDFSLELATSDKEDLTEEKILEKIRKANY